MSHISGSKMRIQEWFSPLERAHNLLKISHFPLRSPNLVLGHMCGVYRAGESFGNPKIRGGRVCVCGLN